ncbi:MAG: energy-coupling factor transporter transmembrane protein EcfT [Firmicutes bacterium]|nr:energy-coupling factor transporter transmembrane protein EcfT [Bacillota bacterium]MBR3375107.1 energy-coupling factor transporter transmembrane protein EcfT [Bacillota bacterium]MBR4024894.1 energy-coupling factor transporter transmembrane protein EcfT [Bacillota bacterium]
MKKIEEYVPPADGGAFYYRTLKSLGGIMSRLRLESGREGRFSLPAGVRLLLMIALIILVSVTQNDLVIMAVGAVALVRLALMPAEDISAVVKAVLVAVIMAVVIFAPAVIMDPVRLWNSIRVVAKILISVTLVGIFNRTTQWNHLTTALRKARIPGTVIFIIDITFRYIVLLGNLMQDLLTAVSLRSIGRNDKKYNSIGGVMGVTFLRGTEMNKEMYEAMQCRGFTDDYEGL